MQITLSNIARNNFFTPNVSYTNEMFFSILCILKLSEIVGYISIGLLAKVRDLY